MSTGRQNSAVGGYGERVAARFLTERGMVLLDRNWSCSEGELDLVLREGATLVACEVKTRTSVAFGHPVEAVGPAKFARLTRLAERWADEHAVRPDGIRIDVVGVLRSPRGAAQVEHVRGMC